MNFYPRAPVVRIVIFDVDTLLKSSLGLKSQSLVTLISVSGSNYQVEIAIHAVHVFNFQDKVFYQFCLIISILSTTVY